MKHIYRSQNERIIAGVCGGFGEYFKIDPMIVRLGWVFLTLFGGSGIIAYILGVIFIPDQNNIDGKPFYKNLNIRFDKSNIWGIVFIIIGIILIFQYNHAIGVFITRFWGFGFNLIFALVIIGLGVYYLSNRRTNLAKKIGIKNSMPYHLSKEDKVLYGVCGGIAESVNLDPTLVRLIWAFGTIMSIGAGIVLYVIFAFILPRLDSE